MRNYKLVSVLLVAVIFATMVSFVGSISNAEEITHQLYINEICTSNGGEKGNLTDIKDNNKQFCDWIELYNPTSSAVNVSGWGITDKPSNPFKSVISSGYSVPAKGFLVIYCSTALTSSSYSVPIALFNISSSGEKLALTNADKATVDKVEVPAVKKTLTYGRFPDGSDNFSLMKPTPKATNNTTTIVLNDPVFSQESGFIKDEFDLAISTSVSDAEIFYTLDGSDPQNSETIIKYTDKIHIKDRTGEKNILSAIPANTYSYSNEELNAYTPPSDDDVDKVTVVRAYVKNSKQETSATITKTYFVGEKANSYGDVAIVSMVTNEDSLFDEKTGIYTIGTDSNGAANTMTKANYMKSMEAAAHIDFFEGDKSLQLSQDCGIKIQGAYSRHSIQKSFRVIARSDYGSSSFEQSFFSESFDVNGKLINKYKSFVLRNGGNDRSNKFTDKVIQNSISDRSCDSQVSRSSLLFLNGEFWGYYIMQADYNKDYLANKYKVDPENVYMSKNAQTKEGNANDSMIISNWYERLMYDNMNDYDTDEEIYKLVYAKDAYVSSSNPVASVSGIGEGQQVSVSNGITATSTCKFKIPNCEPGTYRLYGYCKTGTTRSVMNVKYGDIIVGEYNQVDEYHADKRIYIGDITVENSGDVILEFSVKTLGSIGYYVNKLELDRVLKQNIKRNSYTEYAEKYLDIQNFVDYIALQMYINNGDWPENNFAVWKIRDNELGNAYTDGRIRYLLFDTEYSTGFQNKGKTFNTYDMISMMNVWNTTYPKIIRNLFKNEKFAKAFEIAYQEIANVNFNSELIIKAWDDLQESNKQYLDMNIKRYNCFSYDGINGITTRETQFKNFFSQRTKYAMDNLKKNFSLGNNYTLSINQAGEGGDYVLMNKSKIDFSSLSNNTFSGYLSSSVPVSFTAVPKAGYKFVGWSGDVNSNDAKISITVPKNMSIKANYEPIPASKVCINEICSSNGGQKGNLTSALNTEGKYCDWIELYNNTNKDIDLSGWGISDNEDLPMKYIFPSGAKISANGFLSVYCSNAFAGDNSLFNTGFNISSNGETLILTNNLSDTVDKVVVPKLEEDTTYSRSYDGSLSFVLSAPTPGFTNGGEIPTTTTTTTELILNGDVNSDNTIDIKDTLALRKYLAKWDEPINIKAADYNKDGKVNQKDLLMILKYLSNINSSVDK